MAKGLLADRCSRDSVRECADAFGESVSGGGEAVGSVSGGCVEGAVYELVQEVMASGQAVVQRYGVGDDDAFSVGLTCGGILDVLVEPISRTTFPLFGEAMTSIERQEPVAIVTVVEGPGETVPGRVAGSRALKASQGARMVGPGSGKPCHGCLAAIACCFGPMPEPALRHRAENCSVSGPSTLADVCEHGLARTNAICEDRWP